MSVSARRICATVVSAASFFFNTANGDELLLPPVESNPPPSPKIQSVAADDKKPETKRDAFVFASGPSTAVPPSVSLVSRPVQDEPESIPEPDPVPEPANVEPEVTAAAPATSPATTPPLPPPVVRKRYYERPVYQPQNYRCDVDLPTRWFRADALLWWTSDVDIPVLVTTSPQGTPANEAGVLPTAEPVFGGDNIFGFAQGGVRFRGGRWFEENDGSGIGAELIMLGSRGRDFNASSTGDPILARPFTNLNPPAMEDSQLVAFPGLNTGSIAFDSETRMYSVGLHYWNELVADYDNDCGESVGSYSRCDERGETLLGIQIGPRFTHLDDTILIDETFTSVQSGRNYQLRDSFKTENSFLGGEIGLRAYRQQGKFDLDVGIALGIGGTRQELDIDGLNTITDNGTSTTNRGGFLAHESNFGGWDRTRFSLIPSLDAGVGFETDSGWRFSVAYNLMYWTNVLRAGEQIETGIHENSFLNPTPPPTPGRPVPLFREADYLAHGLSVGIEKSW